MPTVVYGNVSVARAALEVLGASRGPLPFACLAEGVERILGRPVKPHTLRAAVYYHVNRGGCWFEREARGHYRLTAAGRRELREGA